MPTPRQLRLADLARRAATYGVRLEKASGSGYLLIINGQSQRINSLQVIAQRIDQLAATAAAVGLSTERHP